jgi:hypothetical protein
VDAACAFQEPIQEQEQQQQRLLRLPDESHGEEEQVSEEPVEVLVELEKLVELSVELRESVE